MGVQLDLRRLIEVKVELAHLVRTKEREGKRKFADPTRKLYCVHIACKELNKWINQHIEETCTDIPLICMLIWYLESKQHSVCRK